MSGLERKGTQGIRIVNCDPDFLYVAPSMAACAAFIKENRMRFANATSSTGNPGEGLVYDMANSLPGAAARVAGVKFAHSGVIAILTFVACAQLLTWPGLPPEAADSETTVSGSSVLGFSEAR